MIEDRESLAQTAVREAREETGLEVELLNLVGIYSRPNWRKG
jgi:ADP-ribose pyrophosphatase YjhB (NUDIX family)